MRTVLIAFAFVAVLGVVSVLAAETWLSMGGVAIGWMGIGAMILGVVLTLALGVGLMALSFYSNRSGHDAEVDAHQRGQSDISAGPHSDDP